MGIILNSLIFLAITVLVIFVFYFRIKAFQESKKLLLYFEKLQEKLSLQADFSRKVGNEYLPRLSGIYQNRDTLIERTIQEKYKYLVLSISFQNQQQLHCQLTAKSHYLGKEEVNSTEILATNIPFIDKNYYVFGNNLAKIQEISTNFFLPFSQQYQEIWFLFSNLLIFGNRITLVLLSASDKLKYDVLLEKILLSLHTFAQELEKNED